MTTFVTNRYDGKAAVEDGTWEDIQAEAAKNQRSQVEVTEYTGKDEISEQQRRWVHCKSGPIRTLMDEGWSFRDAKEWIKVEYGRQWFVVLLTNNNCRKVDGVFRWECTRVACKKLSHPLDVGSVRMCPYCHEYSLRPIAIKSIMDVSVKNTNLWFDEIFSHMPNIQPPNKEWKKV